MNNKLKVEEAVIVKDPKPEVKKPEPAKAVPVPEVQPASKPIEVKAPKKKEKEVKQPEKEMTKDKPFTLRSIDTGDKVFLIKGGRRFWVMNGETLSKLGFRLGQEKTVTFSELSKYEEGDPLDLAGSDAVAPEKAVKEAIKKEKTKAKEAKATGNKPFKVWE